MTLKDDMIIDNMEDRISITVRVVEKFSDYTGPVSQEQIRTILDNQRAIMMWMKDERETEGK